MKLFFLAAVSAAALAGCAPFEHGHYATDVAYQNTNGDPAGTPLVYTSNPVGQALASHGSQVGGHHAQVGPSYLPAAPIPATQVTYAAPEVYIPQPASYSQSIQVASLDTYSAPTIVHQAHAPVVPAVYSAPVAVAQPTFTPSYVLPAAQTTHHTPVGLNHGFIATTYGGPQIDADGYAICDIPWPAHGINQRPRF